LTPFLVFSVSVSLFIKMSFMDKLTLDKLSVKDKRVFIR
jgi:hypothetical protein